MFSNYKKTIRNKISDFSKITYNKIDKNDMQIGESYFNNRCQYNAVQSVKTGKSKEVYLCVVIDEDNYPVVHFINKNEDKYIDNTLGYMFEYYDYYIIRKVYEDEFKNIGDLLEKVKDMLLDKYVNRIIRKLFKLNYCGI